MKKEYTYLIIAISTIIVGHWVQKVRTGELRKWACSIIGVVFVVFASGSHIYYFVLCVLLNYVIILFVSKRYLSWASYIFTFSFLIFFRTCSYFHLYSPPDTNAIQMMLTLKMVGLAHEIQMADDHSQAPDSKPNIYLRYRPSLLDVFHYAFCYAGILLGPYFKYQTYMDMIYCSYGNTTSSMTHFKQRTRYSVVYILIYASLFYFIIPSYMASEDIFQQTASYRIMYMHAVFFLFRIKMYFLLSIGECGCIMAGIGCYPTTFESSAGAGPKRYHRISNRNEMGDSNKDILYDFETVRNINALKCEFANSSRHAIRNWNMCIQYWMVTVVYKQFPIRSLKILFTFFTTAIWHGTNGGYMLTCLNLVLFSFAEGKVQKSIAGGLQPSAKLIFTWINWLWSLTIFAYVMIPYFLLDVTAILKFWHSIYYLGHLLMIIGLVVAYSTDFVTYRRIKLE